MSIELLVIETDELTISLKGKCPEVIHEKFDSSISMQFKQTGAQAKVQFYDVTKAKMVEFAGQGIQPLFLENGTYELIIIPKNDQAFTFKHEYDAFQLAITKLSRTNILSGNLNFQNEIGLTDLTILKKGLLYMTITIEIFPKKLDYQKDYLALIEEVNEEIYNLAYSFIKRTYLSASLMQYKDPTLSEFYRILEIHIHHYLKAIEQVERLPHHQLMTTHEKVRGERLRKQDSFGRSYLRKNASVFVDAPNGIEIGARTIMPTNGYLVKKIQTYDTHENRYVKWTMTRIVGRLMDLIEKIQKLNKKNDTEKNRQTLELLTDWKRLFVNHLNKPFWRQIGKLDRSVYSLVMQMGIGYREVFKIYTLLSQSLVIHGELYKLSLKDVATLYEYWSFLKVGQILARKCKQISHDIVQVNRDGIYVNLSANESATRVFTHPQTGEKIELKYQYHSRENSQTVPQKPDTMLSIAKVGKGYAFRYILDAKYRLNLESQVGPLNEDINVMHRYRDAIVSEQMNIYERLTFGAYVLFPWHDDEEYRNHPLFLSINKVNIGGLPFLPNSTAFVEELLDNLLNKSGEQLQQEGILPKGTVSYLKTYEDDVLIVRDMDHDEFLMVPLDWIKDNIERVRYVAFADQQGIKYISLVKYIEKENDAFKLYVVEPVSILLLDDIYFVEEYLIVPRNSLQIANTLAELLLPVNLLNVLQRFAAHISVNLDKPNMTQSSKACSFLIHSEVFEIIDSELYNNNTSISLNVEEERLFEWIANKF